mmetsp:Transcript_26659/g.63011  ORF Transcript_26659/g.63011 Transcript_26659/m.63011 type:complete len:103 (+) Transcript_26659:78-386(+)
MLALTTGTDGGAAEISDLAPAVTSSWPASGHFPNPLQRQGVGSRPRSAQSSYVMPAHFLQEPLSELHNDARTHLRVRHHPHLVRKKHRLRVGLGTCCCCCCG